ncbi:STM3941 family protein [Desmospora activa]|uniref:Uncharacterized protein n=1 Tax=Desmospora activa DSM 45169 TaxID=1121389 RepID=A0A2T4Z1X5_9BACL|nr:STM3941 family protein [Desmospora activa]PTM54741.1 hypothetical protein C8J48_3393 [Desmospora activa DSM 45169]
MNKQIEVYPSKTKIVFHLCVYSFVTFCLLFFSLGMMFVGFFDPETTFLLGLFGMLMFILGCFFVKILIEATKILFSSQPLFIFTEQGIWDLSKEGQKTLLKWSDFTHSKLNHTRSGSVIHLYGSEHSSVLDIKYIDMKARTFHEFVNQFLQT